MSDSMGTTAQNLTGALGRVTTAIVGAETSLAKAVLETSTAINNNLGVLEQQDAQINANEQKLLIQERDIQEQKRQRETEHRVWKTQADLTVVKLIAEENNMTVVGNDELAAFKKKDAEHDAETERLRKDGEARASIAVNAAKKEMELHHTASNAQQAAELATTKRELATANETIARLNAQISDERNARIQIETQRAGATINVGAGK